MIRNNKVKIVSISKAIIQLKFILVNTLTNNYKNFVLVFFAISSVISIQAQQLEQLNFFKFVVLKPADDNENSFFGAGMGSNYSIPYRENILKVLKGRNIPALETAYDLNGKNIDPADVVTCNYWIGTKGAFLKEHILLKFLDKDAQLVLELNCSNGMWAGSPEGSINKGLGSYTYKYDDSRFQARLIEKQKKAEQEAIAKQATTTTNNTEFIPEPPPVPLAVLPVKQVIVSDIDTDVPQNYVNRDKTFALIIGNEDYKSSQTGLNDEVNVEFAQRDALLFKEYLVKTIGLPEENVMVLINAKSIEMQKAFDKLRLLAKTTAGQGELIFYYAGHGLPDEQSKEAYLIPVDISGTELQYALKLTDIYAKLTENPIKKATVFLDACFSGGARNAGLVAARGVKVKPKENNLIGNLVVFSASSGDQSAMSYKEKGHGLFTYYLLKKIKETKGNITFNELSEYLKQEVAVKSILVNNKEQNPQVNISTNAQDVWVGWKLGE